MRLDINLSDEDRSGVSRTLNTLLSDEVLLSTKTRNFHWNVAGPQFSDLHRFFESQYNEIEGMIDEVAERSRALGKHPVATLFEFLELSRIKERPGYYPDAKSMVSALLEDHETLIRHLRSELAECMDRYHDAGTSDFLTGLLEKHEKMAWMLRAFLEEKLP